MFFKTLKEYKLSVKSINMKNNQLDDDCIPSLGNLLQNQQVEELYLGNNSVGYPNLKRIGNDFTDKGIEILLPYLIGNTTIKFLDISSNPKISDNSIPILKELIKKTNIENIYAEGTSISGKNALVAPLTENILRNKSLDRISFSTR